MNFELDSLTKLLKPLKLLPLWLIKSRHTVLWKCAVRERVWRFVLREKLVRRGEGRERESTGGGAKAWTRSHVRRKLWKRLHWKWECGDQQPRSPPFTQKGGLVFFFPFNQSEWFGGGASCGNPPLLRTTHMLNYVLFRALCHTIIHFFFLIGWFLLFVLDL